MNRALVVGATGVIGRAIALRLVAEGWNTVCATRSGQAPPGSHGIAVDLLDTAEVARAAHTIGDTITHLFYAAYQPRDNRFDEIEPNTALLANAIDLCRGSSNKLKHVVLVTGGKVYGLQWGSIKTPAREGDPRSLGPNFYYPQEDLLKRRGAAEGWQWTHLIPPFVTGYSDKAPMNLVMVLAVLGTLARELNQPLRFPGSTVSWESLHHLADADQIGAAATWSAQCTESADQVFNVANGDPGRWKHMWPSIASYFGIAAAAPSPLPLAEVAQSLVPVWKGIAQRERLIQDDLLKLVNWRWAEYMFHTAFAKDVLFEIGKIRRAGFHNCLDTEVTLAHRFDELRAAKLIP